MTTAAPADEDVRIAITLASLSYLGEGEPIGSKAAAIRTALQQTDLPTAGAWELAWGPWEHDTSLWYVAVGPNALGVRTAAIVIRGTQMKRIESLLEDFEVKPEPLPWSDPKAPAGVAIAHGFKEEFDGLMAATDPFGLTALDYVRTLGPEIRIDVVGHSLGGAVAPLMALRVRALFPMHVVRAFPFAGQSTGNAAFAQWFTSTFPNQPSRWINRLDVIPMAFWGLKLMKETYAPPGPACPDYIKLLIDVMLPRVGWYSPTGNPARYDGRLYSEGGRLLPWLDEISAQHEHFYYMYLTGISEHVIRERLASWWSPPAARHG